MKKFKPLLFILLLSFIFPYAVKAETINMYLFYGDGCPHCAEEEKFLDKYLKEEKEVKLYKYEIWHSQDNRDLLIKVQDKLNNHENGVPYLVIGEKVLVGYLDGTTDERIKKYVNEYKNSNNYNDNIYNIVAGKEEMIESNKDNKDEVVPTEEKEDIVDEVTLNIFGKTKKLNSKKVSLPVLAITIGFVDGFNPCAMWILIFLITMLINTKDRKKMWILGFTFILTSGIVYLSFMLAWLNLAVFIGKLFFVRLLISIIAFIVGFININKFYQSTKKDDGCDVVDKKNRKKIMNSIMKITEEKKYIISIGGIILLALSVNIIEMMCSVGLPLVFTQILAMNNLSIGSYSLYMFLYILFFLIDDIVVFVIAMTTFKITGISTKYNKYSHLVAGVITLLIGLIMLIKPSLLMFNL